MTRNMKFTEIAEALRKRGYIDKETADHHRVFYEFGVMDFLYSEVAKKFEFDYNDGEVGEVIMTQYWFGTTTFKTIKTIEELYDNI